MCILFFCQSEICQPDGYRLILANNRDEGWGRPTKLADFWGDEHDCISGLDQMPGREGGTWLGMNKNGRIGVLLNILGQQDLTKLGRGFLVSDYLREKTDMMEYAERTLDEKDNYNGFNLVLFDLCKQEDTLTVKPVFVSNACNYFSCVNMRTLPANNSFVLRHELLSQMPSSWKLRKTFFGVSNSPLEYPFQKVLKGKGMFGKIVSQFPNVSAKEHLIENLMNLMADRTPRLPDPVLEKAGTSVGYSPARISQQSAINVWVPQALYGSRTTTIILVDGQGKVDFVERTFEPQNLANPQATTNHFKFELTGDLSV